MEVPTEFIRGVSDTSMRNKGERHIIDQKRLICKVHEDADTGKVLNVKSTKRQRWARS